MVGRAGMVLVLSAITFSHLACTSKSPKLSGPGSLSGIITYHGKALGNHQLFIFVGDLDTGKFVGTLWPTVARGELEAGYAFSVQMLPPGHRLEVLAFWDVDDSGAKSPRGPSDPLGSYSKEVVIKAGENIRGISFALHD